MFLIYRRTALICFTHDGREAERERPHNWRENVFPRSETCRVLHWNSCWKHQESWMLVGLLCEVVPQVPSNTPPSMLPRFSLYPIQHVCFTLLITQPSFLFNNYLSSSSFARFSPTAPSQHLSPLLENFALLFTPILLPPAVYAPHLPPSPSPRG